MAVTKIHAISATVEKAVNYICNPQKTDGEVLVSTFNCGRESVAYDFGFALNLSNSPDKNLAYHIIQSFAPGEISGEEAHQIGTELAERFLKGKYSYVFATHIDRDHIHNHLIFCAADNKEHRKFRSTFKNYYSLRDISDRLCEEHGKSVIKEFKNTGKTYNEWQHDRNGDSWKAQVKKDIDENIRLATNYEDFIRRMKDKGYEIKGETFGEEALKYIAFRPYGKDRFVRGRASTLGPEYTKEKILERISEKTELLLSEVPVQSREYNTKSLHDYLRSYESRKRTENVRADDSDIPTTLIDTSDEKFAESLGLAKWADKENFKRFAAIYAELGNLGLQSPEALDNRIRELREQAHTEKRTVINLEREIKEFKMIFINADSFLKNKKYAEEYNNAKNKDKYYRSHYEQLDLYWGSAAYLKNSGIDTKTLDMKKLQAHYLKLIADKNTLSESYPAKEAECQRLKEMRDSYNQFLYGPNSTQSVIHKHKDKDISL